MGKMKGTRQGCGKTYILEVRDKNFENLLQTTYKN